MMPQHTITLRQANSEERNLIRSPKSEALSNYGYLLAFSVGWMYFLGIALGWLGAWISEEVSMWSQYSGWVFGLITALLAFTSLHRFLLPKLDQMKDDFEAGLVEEIVVSSASVVRISELGNEGPVLCFDIGGGKLLYLRGQFLLDSRLYGVKETEDWEEYEDRLNGLPDPFGFPSSDFEITRLPKSGDVLQIKPNGGYLKPEGEVDAQNREYVFNNSEIFQGQLENIKDVMRMEHHRKKEQA